MSKFVPLILAVSLLMSACAQEGGHPAKAPSTNPTSKPSELDLHADLDDLLKRYVREERLDYLSLRDQDAEALRKYLDRLAAVDLKKLNDKQRLAFYINLYNATMIRAVVDRYVAGYAPSAAEFAVFKDPLVHFGGKAVSLNHLENEIIRKQFSEPRIHVALVCGARACPPILARAYRAEDLDTVLESGMKRFINDETRNTLNSKKLGLSKIFEWYADDFGPSGVLAYLSPYTKIDLSKAELGFRDYAWELNLVAPRDGSWIRLTQSVDGLRKGAVLRVKKREDGRVQVHRANGDALWVSSQKVALHQFAQ